MPPYPVQPTIGCDESCQCRSAARHDPTCPCGLSAIGEPCSYCPPSVSHRAASKSERTKDEVLAEYDRRMAAALASVPPVNPKKRKQGRGPKGTRRTSAQVQRAAEQQARELALIETQATRGTVLEGQMDHEANWLASLKDSE